MSYTKTTWQNGDTITAEKLNNIESGVEEINMSYEKTTWSNGDVITAEKLNNVEDGIAGAGGGSSAFNTAEVTLSVVGNDGSMQGLYVNCIDNDTGAINCLVSTEEGYFIEMEQNPISAGESETYEILIIQGESVQVWLEDMLEPASVTGNATVVEVDDSGGYGILVTGDCVITATGRR